MDLNKHTLKRSKKSNRNTTHRLTKTHRLDYSDKDIESLPKDEADWENITHLNVRGNKIKVLYAYELPRNLIALDIRDNGLEYVIGEFPKTLETLKLDRNNLKYIPDIPPRIKYTIKDNPILPINVKDILENMLATPEKTIFWLTLDTNDRRFKKKEREGINFFSYKHFEIIKLTMYLILNLRNVCHGIIDKGHFDLVLLDSELDILPEKSNQHILLEIEDQRVVAFSVFNIESNHIDIKVLCSDGENKGGGTRIFNIIKAYFKRHENLEKIILDSVYEARGYYTKMGFVFTGKMNETNEVNENGQMLETFPMEFLRSYL